MKRRLIALGVISPLVLSLICVAALLLIGAAAWLLAGQEKQAQIVRIIPLAPLPSLEATSPPSTEPVAVQPTPLPAVEEPVSEEAPQPEPQPAIAENENLLQPEEVEQALGFSLPPGSVNSITQEGVATRLIIPKLDLDRPVILSPIENQTWKVDHLDQSIGHLEGTAPPGANSNLVLAAHVTLASGVYGPFAGLAQLAAGDVIYVYYGDEIFEYEVDNYQIVDRTSVEVTYPTNKGQVTLITCNNWNEVEGRYQERLVVKGRLIEG